MTFKRALAALAKRAPAVLAALWLAITPTLADQSPLFNPTTGSLPGLTMVNGYNSAINALNTCNSAASAPTNQLSASPSAGNCWYNTSTGAVSYYDGTDWLTAFYLDATNHILTGIEGGGAATTVASATTTNLCGASNAAPIQPYLTISGTTTITSFGSNCIVGQFKIITFSGILTLTYNGTSLILPTAANITTAAGDMAVAVSLGSGNWRVAYFPASGPLPFNIGATGIINGTSNGPLFNNGGYAGNSGAGTAGQVYTSNGSGSPPTFQSVGRTLLNTLTASNSATLADITDFTATFSEYDIVLENIVPATNDANCEIQINSGAAYKSTGYVGNAIQAASSSASAQAVTTYIPCSVANTTANSAPGISGTFHVSNPAGTSAPKTWFGTWGGAGQVGATASGWTGGNGAVAGFQLLFSSGNITSGVIKIYGSN